jgi:hypothetical protein
VRSVEFLLRLLDGDDPPAVSAEDLDGPHGSLIRAWQAAGFVAREPGLHPTPSCPHCGEGVPYRLGGRLLCPACRGTVDPRHLHLWPLDREAILRAVASHLGLRGGIRTPDGALWRLGAGEAEGEAVECFFCRVRPSDPGRRQLAACRRVLVLHGPDVARDPGQPGRWVPLLGLFAPDGSLAPTTPAALLRPRGAVRFEGHSGTLWVGDGPVGELPVGSREYHLVACLAEALDHFVPYRDLKREVLRRTGGSGEIDEATFCQKLKSRIKARYAPGIDRLIATTNKGDGFRLRAAVEPWEG